MEEMRMNEGGRKRVIASLLALAIGLASFGLSFPVADGSLYKGTTEYLDGTKTTALEITGAATAASVAVSLLPGDAATPIADKLADLAGDFVIVFVAIFLEKYLCSMAGLLGFRILIPLACLGFILTRWFGSEYIRRAGRTVSLKVVLFSLILALIVPLSVTISKNIERTYEESFQETISSVTEESNDIKEHATEDASAFEKFLDSVKGGVNTTLNLFQGYISKFTEAIAIMIVTTCLIPLAVLGVMLWIMKLLTGIQIPAGKLRSVRNMARPGRIIRK